jgi:probable HAF family extracellular repeat protein
MYSITDLGGGTAYGINNNGQVVGQNGAGDAFIYSGAIMTDLGAGSAYGINDNGQVVGGSSSTGDAFLYSNGTMTDLGNWGGLISVAYGINNNGQIVGMAQNTFGYNHAIIYSSGTSTYLGTLGGSISQANRINGSGQIAGTSSTLRDQGQVGFLYVGSSMTPLPFLSGTPRVAYNSTIEPLAIGHKSNLGGANDINDNGQIVGWAGYSSAPQADSHAFLYSGGTMTDLGTLGGQYACANGINNNGQVVGESWLDATETMHAFLYEAGTMTDLNDLIAPNSGWILTTAAAINDNGQIICSGIDSSDQTDAFLLTPVPEPDSLLLLTLGGMAMMLKRMRRKLPGETRLVRLS